MSNLNAFLNQLQKNYHRSKYLDSDPLEFVHRYTDPYDQEAVALLSAVLAYGKVAQIRKSVQDALSRMKTRHASPADFVRSLNKPLHREYAHTLFKGYVHRFNVGSDIVLLLWLLNQSWQKYGSLGSHLTQFLEPNAPTAENALISLIAEWRAWLGKSETSTFNYLLTSPADGSCCKRWCMFLRWMGRKDHLDPGLWTKTGSLAHTFQEGRYLKSSQLIMPLDTHTGRISQYLGLTQRKSLNWKAAVEITQALQQVDPKDPTRFDFALSRLGILDICQRSYRAEICVKCELLPACGFATRARKRAA